jgi:hypothetical protein
VFLEPLFIIHKLNIQHPKFNIKYHLTFKSIKIMLNILKLTIFLLTANLFAQPIIKIEGNGKYNWGNVEIGKMPVKTKIKIFNNGNKDLIISEAKQNCSCTTISLDKTTVKPKDYATLDVKVDIHSDGAAEKYVTIKSNDPTNPSKVITLNANVIGHLSFSEKVVNFRNATTGRESTYHLKLKNNTTKPIKILDIKIDPNTVTSSLKKGQVLAPKKEIDVTISYKPTGNAYMNGAILLKTDDKEVGDFGLTVLGTPIK